MAFVALVQNQVMHEQYVTGLCHELIWFCQALYQVVAERRRLLSFRIGDQFFLDNAVCTWPNDCVAAERFRVYE